jgi:hypothetical protein
MHEKMDSMLIHLGNGAWPLDFEEPALSKP